MTVLKNLCYTLLILACIAVCFVAIPVLGFICSMLLTVAAVTFLGYFIYVGVGTLREMDDSLKKEKGSHAKM